MGSTKNGFCRWLNAMELDLDAAAKMLGRTRRCMELYEQGKQRPPYVVRLAMAALYEGWRPRAWPDC